MIITNEDVLRISCTDVLPEEIGPLREALQNELDRANELGNYGIGLAAPQIGIAKKMAIVRVGKTGNSTLSVDLVNAKIIHSYDAAIFEQEGCLSFPGRYEKTSRFQEIHVNNDIETKNFIATGLFAVVIQHELDHLQGILLPDVALPSNKNIIKQKPNEKCLCGSNLKFKKCHGR